MILYNRIFAFIVEHWVPSGPMVMVLIITGGLEAVNVKADFKVPRLQQVAPGNSVGSSYDSSQTKRHTGQTNAPGNNTSVLSYDSSTNFRAMVKSHTGHTEMLCYMISRENQRLLWSHSYTRSWQYCCFVI